MPFGEVNILKAQTAQSFPVMIYDSFESIHIDQSRDSQSLEWVESK
jgi:hypothetical protein